MYQQIIKTVVCNLLIVGNRLLPRETKPFARLQRHKIDLLANGPELTGASARHGFNHSPNNLFTIKKCGIKVSGCVSRHIQSVVKRSVGPYS
jgi:hypothetical protein